MRQVIFYKIVPKYLNSILTKQGEYEIKVDRQNGLKLI